ncbi:hypothetical protein ASA01S_038_00120 [Aeromonas salmonicida subsp. masoucida NBRC 13784]|nr:hypothetical protein ASA01S_038_00120 [Aeromonas salmonicida subsp. masoucida NBRC 13784]
MRIEYGHLLQQTLIALLLMADLLLHQPVGGKAERSGDRQENSEHDPELFLLAQGAGFAPGEQVYI